MTDLALHLWDGQRPRLRRDVIARHQRQIGRLGVVAASENLAQPTDWAFAENHHMIVVHLDGRLDRMDCEFSAGPSGPAIPSRGDVWMIPAGCRYAALAQGKRARYIEFNVPTGLIADAPLKARVQHRDAFLFAAAERLSDLVAKPADDITDMASHAIVDALQAHLLQRYGFRDTATNRRSLSTYDRTLIVDAISSQLDARLSLAMLAAVVDMDVRQFTSVFKGAFGLSPWQFVLRKRLDEAARLLRETNEAVTGIALAVGFATPSHFATAFAQRFGVPPTRYRISRRA